MKGEKKRHEFLFVNHICRYTFGNEFCITKNVSEKAGIGTYAGLFFNAASGLFTAIIFWGVNRFAISFSVYSLIMVFIWSGLVAIYMMIGFRILKSGNMSYYTLFLMTGGMVVPYIWGVLFLNEPLTLMRTIGIMLIILSIVITNLSGSKPDKKLIMLCAVIFFLNGFVSVVSKLHQVNTTYETIGTTDFVFWSGIMKFIICGLALLFFKRKNDDVGEVDVKVVLPIVCLSAIVSGVSSICQLKGAISIPATVLYPLVTGGTIILSSITGCIVFKEKLAVRQWISVGICFAGTCLFL